MEDGCLPLSPDMSKTSKWIDIAFAIATLVLLPLIMGYFFTGILVMHNFAVCMQQYTTTSKEIVAECKHQAMYAAWYILPISFGLALFFWFVTSDRIKNAI